MSVHVHFNGRMGNNMFQYALGRIISERTGWQLICENINRDLPETFGIPIDCGMNKFHNQEYFPNAVSFIPGEILPDPITITEFDYKSVDDIIAMSGGKRGIILHDFFQRSKYYIDWRDKLREWFKPTIAFGTKNNHLAMHFRRADYLESRQQLNFDYYDAAAEIWRKESKGEIYLTGDGIGIMPELECRYDAELVRNDSDIEDFCFLKSSSAIACANSSFSWWAAFLGNAERVFIPQPRGNKYWSRNSNQQLMCDFTGWELVECE